MAVLGKVAVTPKGTYNSSLSYEKLDIVTHDGASYIAIKDAPIGISPTDINYFQVLSSRGEKGDTGTSYTYRWDGTALIISADGVDDEPVELAGVSPSVSISKTENGNTITITDYKGSHDFTVSDGVSPVITTTDNTDGHTVKIVHADGTDEFKINDGISPIITAIKEGKITTIKIVDVNGERTLCTISDGVDGDGSGDMLMSTYDSNNDGVVNMAAALASTAKILISQVTDLEDVLAGKSDNWHTHEMTEVNGLENKINEIISGSGVGDMLMSTYDTDGDGIVDKAEVATVAEALNDSATIEIKQVAGLTESLGSKAASVHQHATSDITDFEHSHTTNEISDFDTAVDNRIQSAELGVEIDTKVTEGSGNAVSSGAVYDALSDVADKEHTHGNITHNGAIGTVSGNFVMTGSSGVLQSKTPADALTAIGAASSEHNHDSAYAASAHNHNASNITSGTLPIARGGTNITSNPSMLVNLASTSAASVFAANPQPGVTGKLPVSKVDAGTFSGQMVANASAIANTNVAQVRNIVIGTSDPTTTTCPVGCIYFKLGDPI